jgi:dTDP-4-dehydrorhamnose 3,5-epimerase
LVRKLARHIDERGWLTELFREDELPDEYRPVMCYASMTKPGVARGPHEHREQTDCFAFPGPSTFRIYLWDNRPESATYGNRCRFEAGEGHPLAVLIPPGVVHAYKNIGPVDGIVLNAPDRLYAGAGKKGPLDEIRYEDSDDRRFSFDD